MHIPKGDRRVEHNFTIAKKGYLPAEVDRHIEKLQEELNNFRSDQVAIAKAIIHSENTAQRIIDDANREADQVKLRAEAQLLELQKKIKHMRMKLDAFQSNYNQLMHKYIITMNNDDFNDLFTSLDNISDSLTMDSKPQQTSNIVAMKYEKAVADY